MRKSAPTAKLFCRDHWTNSTCHSSLTTHNTLSSNKNPALVIALRNAFRWRCVSQLGRPVREILGCRGQGIEDQCARFKCEIVAGELRRKMRRGSAGCIPWQTRRLAPTQRGAPTSSPSTRRILQESCTQRLRNEGEIATPPAPERTPWQATRASDLQSQRLRSVEVTRNRSPPSWMAPGAFHSKSGESQEAVPDEGPDTRLAQTEWRATARNSEGGHPATCQFPRIVKAGPTGHPDASGTHAWLKKTRKLNDKQQKR